MQLIKTNSSEHRALITEALIKGQTHILRQLQLASQSGKPKIRLMNDFMDALMASSMEENYNDEEEVEVVLDEHFYTFLHNNK